MKQLLLALLVLSSASLVAQQASPGDIGITVDAGSVIPFAEWVQEGVPPVYCEWTVEDNQGTVVFEDSSVETVLWVLYIDGEVQYGVWCQSVWDTRDPVFVDGFESGDTSAWSPALVSPARRARSAEAMEQFIVRLRATDAGGNLLLEKFILIFLQS